MKHKILVALFILAVPVLTTITTVQADSWQEKMLFNPAPAMLEMEASRHRVMIYEGLKDVQVSMAMEQQFDRIEHMMFIGTVVTDQRGESVIDPETGSALLENDGC